MPGSQQLGALFQIDDVEKQYKLSGSSTSWAVKGVRAHHRALSGDSRDVIDTITGGPPKHYTQPDFGAAWRPHNARGPLSRVFNVTMTSHCQCDLTISMERVREKPS